VVVVVVLVVAIALVAAELITAVVIAVVVATTAVVVVIRHFFTLLPKTSSWNHLKVIHKVPKQRTGKHEMKELQQTATFGAAHKLREVLM
jgi:MFS superfamily sulfate permease-like transporter